MQIQLIAAKANNDVIGNGNKIPWRAEGELKLFKAITMGGTLIMGRKTFDSIGKSLPGRKTIVISRDLDLKVEGCEVVHSLEQALALATQKNLAIFVAGGGDIYRQALPMTDILHLTTIDIDAKGDVLFPAFNLAEFELLEEQHYSTNLDYTYRKYMRTT